MYASLLGEPGTPYHYTTTSANVLQFPPVSQLAHLAVLRGLAPGWGGSLTRWVTSYAWG
jgi:hypothetical protein